MSNEECVENKNFNLQKFREISDDNDLEFSSNEEFSCNQSSFLKNKLFDIKPFPKLSIKNFQFDKVYKEKIHFKNLLEFPIWLNLKSSDTKKLEINLSSGTLKLSPLQNISLDIRIKIQNKNTKNYPEKIKLYITITSELVVLKYPIELELKGKEIKSNNIKYQPMMNEPNPLKIGNLIQQDKMNSTLILETKLKNPLVIKNNINEVIDNVDSFYIEQKIIKKNQNEYEKSNFWFNICDCHSEIDKYHAKQIENEILEKDNLYLKEKLASYLSKLKEMEDLIATYSKLIEEFSSSSFNNLFQIENSDNFELVKIKNLNLNNYNRDSNQNFYKKIITEDQCKFRSVNLNEDENIFGNIGISNLQKKLDLKLNYIDWQKHIIDFDKKINIHYIADSSKKINKKELFTSKIDLVNINDQIINSFKERFIQIQYSDLIDNRNRMSDISEIFRSLLNLTTSLYIKSEKENESQSHITNFAISDYIPLNTNSFKYELQEFEKIIKSFLNNVTNFNKSITSWEQIDNELVKRISLISQEPLLSNLEIDYLCKEIQNISLLTQELARSKFHAEKLNYENISLINENEKIKSTNEKLRSNMRCLEMDLDLFKKEILQKEDSAKLREKMLERLQNDIDEIKNNYVEGESHHSYSNKQENNVIDDSSQSYESNYYSRDYEKMKPFTK